MRMAHQIAGVVLAVALVTGGMAAGWYGWENHRGNQVWDQTRRDLEARGEALSFRAFIPPAVPDEQNLALAPVFVRLYRYKVDPRTGLMTFNQEGSTHAAETAAILPYGKGGNLFAVGIWFQPWMTGHPMDLAKQQKYFQARQDFPHPRQPQTAAEDVRLALTRFNPLLDEIAAAAAQRPLGRFPVNWTVEPAAEIALPQYRLLQQLTVTLQLRAVASLALGQTDAAVRDVSLGLRLGRTLETDPVILGSLVDVVCLELLLQPVWEGLAQHRWSAQQLAQLQAQLSRVDLISDLQRNERADRAGVVIPLADDLERNRNFGEVQRMQTLNGNDSDAPIFRWLGLLLHVFPRGWFAEAKAVACRLDQRNVIDAIRPGSHRLSARTLEDGAAEVHRLPLLASTLVAKICLPVGTSVGAKVAQTQAFVDEGVVACALERYALEHHGYPAKLDELVPALIERVPPDVIDGAPMRYRRTPEGNYRLWEVGWNGVDEGGRPAFFPGSPRLNANEGDWVWQFTPVEKGTGAGEARRHADATEGGGDGTSGGS